jgi:hypothetical protein
MRPEVSSTPPVLNVRRHFETNRMAGDCQGRAYEQVLPVAGRSEWAVAASSRVNGNEVDISTLTEEGAVA